MTGPQNNGWTIQTYAAHNEALRLAEEKFQAERNLRYAEVKAEQEKALQIKEKADEAALNLARDIQVYKDEKANELREQINSERGLYATKGDLQAVSEKIEATIKPLSEYVSTNRGKGEGISLSWAVLLGTVALIAALFAMFTRQTAQPPQILYSVPAPPGTMLPGAAPPSH